MLRTMERKMIAVSSAHLIRIKHHHESKRLATQEGGYSERAPGGSEAGGGEERKKTHSLSLVTISER